MKLFFLLLLFLSSFYIYAQQSVTVYTYDDCKYVGKLISVDSAKGFVKVQVQGGSEFSIGFNNIDSIQYSNITGRQSFIGLGLGTNLSTKNNDYQVDLILGYKFNQRWSASFTYCFSEFSAAFLDLHYYVYNKENFAVGLFSDFGTVMKPSIDRSAYANSKLHGLYTNHGLTIKLSGDRSRSSLLSLGYQYIDQYQVFTGPLSAQPEKRTKMEAVHISWAITF
jgi:hypothetical protein